MRRSRRAAALLGLALTALACGPPPAPVPPGAHTSAAPRWSDALAEAPDVYAVVRPQALKRDAVYGSLFGALVRAAEARGFARGATMLEAVSGAEEIVVAVGSGGDAAIVLRSVPAKLDPSKVADARGVPLFRPREERARIVEYELADAGGIDGALFVLPDRSWVGALGPARARARRAFARPSGRPAPEVDGGALVFVRVHGAIARALTAGAPFGGLLRGATRATLTLQPGARGLGIAVEYGSEAASADALAEAERVIAELSKRETYEWLDTVELTRTASTLSSRVSVPPRLLEALPSASGADLDPLRPGDHAPEDQDQPDDDRL